MKNVHLLPTDKPSRLSYVICTEKSTLTLFEDEMEKGKRFFPQNIYITSSDEEIKEGDWVISNYGELIKISYKGSKVKENVNEFCKKIILTTDQDLINDGVQDIEDEFLEWFVKNPSCEFVETQCSGRNCIEDFGCTKEGCNGVEPLEIIIPQEELKHPKVFSENGNELFFDEQGNLIIESINPCKEIVLNDKATVDVPFHNKHIRFENLTSEQANYLLQVSEFYQLSGTRRSAEIPQEELKQEYVKCTCANSLEYSNCGKKCERILDEQEPKQETLEEANWKVLGTKTDSFYNGAKWMEERMYSEEECYKYLHSLMTDIELKGLKINDDTDLKQWFEQFKKK